jgi:hypothetical protein
LRARSANAISDHLRKEVRPVGAERQRLLPEHGIERKGAVEMGKELAAAGGVRTSAPPPNAITIDGDEQEVVHAGKMTPGGFHGIARPWRNG